MPPKGWRKLKTKLQRGLRDDVRLLNIGERVQLKRAGGPYHKSISPNHLGDIGMVTGIAPNRQYQACFPEYYVRFDGYKMSNRICRHCLALVGGTEANP